MRLPTRTRSPVGLALAGLALAGLALAGLTLAACRPTRPRAGTGGPGAAFPTVGAIERLDPALDRLVSPGARIEQLARGFQWAEGPVWRRDAGGAAGGYLLFSDVPGNTIYRWQDGRGLSVFLRPSGFAGPNPPGRELGSNGLTLDLSGALVVADHGNRMVARVDDRTFTKTVLADRFEGRRLNSPNDVTFGANGDLYFTDPPYGLRGQDADPAKELAFNGVYRRAADGTLGLVTRELSRPNGIALSPDGRTLYVANSDPARAVWMAYDVAPDGSVAGAPAARGRVVFDATRLVGPARPGLPDGMRVAADGTLFATGPGGVLVLTPGGRHLGTIVTGQPTANCAFGDDGRTLYLTANDRLLRVRLLARGAGF
jgi:gluconolactonase